MRHLKGVLALALLAGFSAAHGQGYSGGFPAWSPDVRVATLYVSATAGNDSWSGRLAEPNWNKTDGPLATMDGARLKVEALDKTNLREVDVLFRGGTYSLAQAVMFGPADTGSADTQIVYESFPGEQPVFSGGVRVTGWVNNGGNTWLSSIPPMANFENLYYNGQRRLRPRVGGTVLGQYFRTFKTIYIDTQHDAEDKVGCPHKDTVVGDAHYGQYECSTDSATTRRLRTTTIRMRCRGRT